MKTRPMRKVPAARQFGGIILDSVRPTFGTLRDDLCWRSRLGIDARVRFSERSVDSVVIEQLGNVGELVAAVATLATLVYLARQIRQSNQIARWEAHRSSVVAYGDVTGRIFSDADTARVFRDGLLDPDALDEVDRIRLHHVLSQTVLNFKDVLEAHDLGFYDDATYTAWEGYTCSVLNMPGGARWWQDSRGSFIGRVRDAIEAGRAEVPTTSDLAPWWWSSEPSGGEVRVSKRESHVRAGIETDPTTPGR